jgi:hypothetical protein
MYLTKVTYHFDTLKKAPKIEAKNDIIKSRGFRESL